MNRDFSNPAGTTLPAKREQICLNGEWPVGGSVPRYLASMTDFDYNYFPDIPVETFIRKVGVPASWTGKTIMLDFNAVNFLTEIFVDDRKVADHTGGWIPFSVDITDYASPGSDFVLRLVVRGRAHQPCSDENGLPLWPVGDIKKKMDNRFSGIVDDVHLRAYGEVHLRSPRIVTSSRKNLLSVEYEVRNTSDRPRRVHLACEVVSKEEGIPLLSFRSEPAIIPPGSTLPISATSPGRGLETWRPDRPTLFLLVSRIVGEEDNGVLDKEMVRFGFREVWIEGKNFVLDGVRLNLRGDFVEFGEDLPVQKFYPENWRQTVRDLKALNLNSFRPHKYPCPEWALDIADEEGLIIISETAVTGDSPLWRDSRMNLDAFVENFKKWIGPWAMATRTHASVLFRAAANEMYTVPAEACLAINETIRRFDDSRPIFWEDRDDIREHLDIVNHHYPRPGDSAHPWNGEPWNCDAGLYDAWKEFLEPDKPTLMGEGLNVPGTALPNLSEQRNMWWQGIWCRIMRYQDWAEISPSSAYGWICKFVSHSDIRVKNYRNAMNPVALFDKEYDGLGIAPFVTGLVPGGELPVLISGERAERRLILYNDEFEKTLVTARVEIHAGKKVFASCSAEFEVELGEHIELVCAFQVPAEASGLLEMTLRTEKGGMKRFEETRSFALYTEAPDTPQGSWPEGRIELYRK